MIKKIAVFIITCFVLAVIPSSISSATKPLNIYLFWGAGCPHCAAEKEYLADLLPDYPEVVLNKYEIYYNQGNSSLMKKVSDRLGANASGIPFLIIGDEYIVGFSDGVTNKTIEERIKECTTSSCPDSVASIVNGSDEKIKQTTTQNTDGSESLKEKKIIKLPLIGEVDAMDYSLPVITIIIGALDGFNPCAMWTLLFLISLLLSFNDRRKMWLFGTVFIVASSFVYFLFMVAWLKLILFLGFIVWVRIAIGSVALLGGAYGLRKGIKNKDGGCDVTGSEEKQVVFKKLREIVKTKSTWLALGGLVVLAFAVNLVELVCSAGLPAVYIQILTLNGLDVWQYYGYILLYIFFFMIDDIIIFVIAMLTLKMTGISTKYSRYSSAIGGVLMIIISLLLIIKPELLMF